jgi:RNA polymerase sigma-70 factor (ECF subfamily)
VRTAVVYHAALPMVAKLEREKLRGLVEPHWRRLYNFLFRLTLDHDRAARYLVEVYALAIAEHASRPTADSDVEVWLLGLANQLLEQRLSRQPEVNFDILDETLRSEATRTDVVRSLSDPQRDLMLWELKQGCMTAVVNCLPPGERAAFVTCHVLKLPDEAAAKSLAITESAYKVRLSRARKKVGDYLAPRCEHVNPHNPCRCPARVGTALHKGFIKPLGPVGGEVSLRKPSDVIPYGRYGTGLGNEDVPMRDISAIYGGLPEPEPPSDLGAQVLAQLSA